jgi:hypothetical protein
MVVCGGSVDGRVGRWAGCSSTRPFIGSEGGFGAERGCEELATASGVGLASCRVAAPYSLEGVGEMAWTWAATTSTHVWEWGGTRGKR